MRVYMAPDIEGISGYVEWDNYADNSPAGVYKRTRMRQIYTREVNAAVEGCLEGGATEVLIFDGHAPGNHNDNLLIEDLHPEAQLIIGGNYKGSPQMFPMVGDGFDVCVLVGRHAMAGTPNACLPHTLMTINDQDFGEIGYCAAACGSVNVPVVFISGDKAAVDEMQLYTPNVEYVITKWAFGPYSIRSRSVRKTEELTREGCRKAILRSKEIKPFRLEGPYRISNKAGRAVENENLIKAMCEWTDPKGEKWGNQDINPERAIASEKRKALAKSETAYNPFIR